MSHFVLRCRDCGARVESTPCTSGDHCHDALLVSAYDNRQLGETDREGIWRFDWLPVHTPAFPQAGPAVYQSEGLSRHLGIDRLYIAFNGYWPERGALLETCTFKEFEAAVVIENARERGMRGLTVASAGNTARAFAHLCCTRDFASIIVVPTMCLTEMWYLETCAATPTIAVGDGDYADSIEVARRIADSFGLCFEGGVRNVAKRDGLGVVLLEAATYMGRLPDHYFQAVGSGAGAIGVWEMAERFLDDGRFGAVLPVLHLAQNLPFAPMVKAWERNSRSLFKEDLRPELIGEITTRVLSTRYPAYAVRGGVYDALTATRGRMYGVTNEAVFSAMDLFERAESIDIVPAAGVAVAALREAVSSGVIGKGETILLNITGGGEKRLKQQRRTCEVETQIISKKISEKELEVLLRETLKKH